MGLHILTSNDIINEAAHNIIQERIRTAARVRVGKILNWGEFTTSIKNGNTHCACCVEIHVSHFVNVVKYACDQCSILAQFNIFDRTMGFYWSYSNTHF